jgi:limonene-1,2-epoxide hydrolase
MEAVLNGSFGQIKLGLYPLTIGRTPGNQLILTEPKVSSYHAEIRPQGQDYAIVDLGSTHGTFVNDQRLTSNQPNVLRPGDTVVIGDTRFTYDVPGVSETEPTIYAGSKQGNNSVNTPAVAASSPPYTGYGADAQHPGAYQPPPLPVSPGYEQASYPQGSPYYGAPVSDYGADAQPGAYQAPPPPAYADFQPSGYPQGASYPGAPVSPPAPRLKRRGLWIILSAIGGVVVIAIILFVVIGYVNRTTPTTTLNAFCSALKSGDYRTAYTQLSSGLQSKVGSEANFAAGYASNGGLGKITDCTVSNVNDGAGTATINYTTAQGNRWVSDYKLADENGSPKIISQQPRSAPTVTLGNYCGDLEAGDYQSAYNQLSSSQQSLQTEAQFAANFSSSKVANCSVSTVNDTAGTGTIHYTFANGVSLVADYTLVNENSTWKMKAEQTRSTPTLTLATFCKALKVADYQTAYNQFSRTFQSQETEAQFAQFAAILISNEVTSCTMSTFNDTAGTGTVSYTFANGGSLVVDYTLVNENSTWKIENQQLHSAPVLTLTNFCYALETGDYQTAYTQLSSIEQSQITEPQLAAALSTNKVTKCALSTVNDTAGTGTISYTFAHGNTSVIAYALINDNGIWKINSGKQTA